MDISKQRERGISHQRRHPMGYRATPAQAVLLIALLMVVLLGFIGLAVDGGTLYFYQRNARNAADAAVLAAVYAMCTNYGAANRDELVDAAALAAAQANGFGLEGDTTTSVTVQIGAEIPNEVFPPGFSGDKSDYVRVLIWADSPTYLIHMVYSGATEVSADAVGQCRPETNPFPSQAIVALGNECAAIDIGGDGAMVTVDGGIFSNSDKCKTGPCANNASCDAVRVRGSSSIDIDDPGIGTSGCIDGASGTQCTAPLSDPLAEVPPPDEACRGTKVSHSGAGTINPGYYSEIKLTNGTLTLTPGVYCIDSGAQNKGFVSTGGTIIANGVVIYIKSGVFSLSGNGNHSFSAPTYPDCQTYDTCDWEGLMIWVDRNNFPYPQGGVEITGGSGSQFVGTIYAPVNKCTITGNGATLVLDAQFICYMVETTGTGDIEVHYDPNDVYKIPPALSYNK